MKEILLLSEREYRCDKCDVVRDRDLNAALNLEQYPRLAETGSVRIERLRRLLPLHEDNLVQVRSAEVGTKPERTLALTN